ncbi:MAG TPA: hypothetical protein VF988_13010 [Verrucomicrobiae bacterium]
MSKRNNLFVIFLGKTLFPGRAPRWQRVAALSLLWAIAAGVFTGGGIFALLLLGAKYNH